MLFILPPPTAPTPPSPWDLIINFNRKGYQKDEYTKGLSVPKKAIKDSFKDRREHKTFRETCKLSSTHQTNVRQIFQGSNQINLKDSLPSISQLIAKYYFLLVETK